MMEESTFISLHRLFIPFIRLFLYDFVLNPAPVSSRSGSASGFFCARVCVTVCRKFFFFFLDENELQQMCIIF